MDMFSPVALGRIELSNRIVMAPMTRSRAEEHAMPGDLMLEYYRQRAGAGLVITEGIAPSADGLGYCRTPGIYSNEQALAWRRIVDAVHAEGGSIVAQIMHVGRAASTLNKPPGSETVAPSAKPAAGEIYTDEGGMQPFDAPRALSIEEIPGVVQEFRRATELALEAGFDGVELHCTSGYLPAQFISSGSNQRDDAYGGDAAGRCRFPLEVLTAMAGVDGPGRVGMRICPDNPFNDIYDEDPAETYGHFLSRAAAMDLAYLHVIRFPAGRVDNITLGRRYFGDRLIVNESYTFEEASGLVSAGDVAAVSFGRPFIANPDLVERWRRGMPLAEFDAKTLYSPGPCGYTDYPPA